MSYYDTVSSFSPTVHYKLEGSTLSDILTNYGSDTTSMTWAYNDSYPFTSVTGKDGAAVFGGTNDTTYAYDSTTNTTNWLGDPFGKTFNFWLNRDSTTKSINNTVIEKLGASATAFRIVYQGALNRFRVRLNNADSTQAQNLDFGSLNFTGTDFENQWNMFSFVFPANASGNYVKLYINGVYKSQVALSATYTSFTLDGRVNILGSSVTAVGTQGATDEFTIFPSQLTEANLRSIYNSARNSTLEVNRISPYKTWDNMSLVYNLDSTTNYAAGMTGTFTTNGLSNGTSGSPSGGTGSVVVGSGSTDGITHDYGSTPSFSGGPFLFLEAIFKTSQTSGTQYLYENDYNSNGSDANGYNLRVDNGVIKFSAATSGGSYSSSITGPSVGDGEWHHVVVYRAENYFYLVLDNTSYQSNYSGVSYPAIQRYTSIGRALSNGNAFNGEIDYVSLSVSNNDNTYWTADDASRHYNAYYLNAPHGYEMSATALTASAAFADPAVTTQQNVSASADPATASALFADPAIQISWNGNPASMTADAELLTPIIATTDSVTIPAPVLSASAHFDEPNVQGISNANVDALPFAASALFTNTQPIMSGNNMEASALMTDASISLETNALIIPTPFSAKSKFVTPPAYYILTEDTWFNRLYAQQKNNTTSGRYLHFFKDTSVITSGTLTNQGPTLTAVTPTLSGFFTTPTPSITGGIYEDNTGRIAALFKNISVEIGPFANATNDRGYTIEMMINTTKATQILSTGIKTSTSTSGSTSSQIGIVDGKLYTLVAANNLNGPTPEMSPKTYDQLVALKLNPTLIKATKTNVADGNWHHIVFQYGYDERLQIWVDGKLELQKYTSNPPTLTQFGYNSADTTLSSEFLISAVGFNEQNFLSNYDLQLNYYAAVGYTPIVAAPMTATADAGQNSKATGNRGRALMLYFWPTERNTNNLTKTFDTGVNDPFDEDTFDNTLTTIDFINDAPQQYYGWDIFPVDVTGEYVSEIVNRDSYVNIRRTNIQAQTSAAIVAAYDISDGFRDDIDNRRYIDLINDIDLSSFDAIFFRNYPDQAREINEFEKDQEVDEYFNIRENIIFQNFLSSLRSAVDTGMSLMVTNHQLAIDLGIIDRVEEVSDGDDLAGRGDVSDPYSPTVGPDPQPGEAIAGYPTGNGALWYDTYKNNRLRVLRQVTGLTDDASLIWTDTIYYRPSDITTGYGEPNRYSNRYEIRNNGLQVGDEFIISDYDYSTTSYYAVPFANIKAGKAVTAFANNIRKGLDLVPNPYKNHATSIIVEPGDVLSGTQCGGKIYVNFTERLSGKNPTAITRNHGASSDYALVDLITDQWINYSYSTGQITSTEKEALLASEDNLDRKLENNTISQAAYDDLVYWSLNGNYVVGQANKELGVVSGSKTDGADPETSEIVKRTVLKISKKGTVSTGAQYYTNTQFFTFFYSRLFNTAAFEALSMLTRGFRWLSNREFYTDIPQRPLAATATAEMVTPTVVADFSTTVTAQVMLASGTIVETSIKGPDIVIAPLPMQANAAFGAYTRKLVPEPLAGSATFPAPIVSTSAIDEVVLYVMHEDPILYIREDVIN